MNKKLKIATWVSFFLLVIIILFVSNKNRKKQPCNDIFINIDAPEQTQFVTKSDIEKIIFSKYKKFINTPIENIPINEIEKTLYTNIYIKRADVYPTLNGKIGIEIQQRKPMFRVFGFGKFSYYYDQDAYLLPLSDEYTANVFPVIFDSAWNSMKPLEKLTFNTYDTLTKTHILKQTYKLVNYIQNDSILKSLTDYIFVNRDGEFEIIPKVGNHIIELGSIEDMDIKFKKLILFYKKSMHTIGWKKYKKINLRYKNQIVCTKREIA